ncbi:MAG: DNA mismatch repair protein MutS [Clostridia bacterium]|nr:DNA mismatch repair protein MutS [Clostridia bacterium]
MSKISPMMEQYLEIKEANKDSIVFFRVGDFYEMFFDDAKTASEELELVLTGKDCGLDERAPMCGIPYHSCDAYIARLIEKGRKVAICEQVENPATAKGIVKREIVRIITPGTVIENTMLDEGVNNYLAAVCISKNDTSICFTDASTGECFITTLSNDKKIHKICEELARFKPREVLITEKSVKENKVLSEFFEDTLSGVLTFRNESSFNPKNTEPRILSHFSVISTENLGIETESSASAALGAVLEYLYETGVSGDISVNKVEIYTDEQYMKLDMTAVRNLELIETMRSKSKKGSLLWVLDKTKTAMGKRLLRGFVTKPLLNIAQITARQNAVDELFSKTILRGEIGEYLSGIRDIERIMTKVVYGTANARDLNAIANTAINFPALKSLLADANSKLLKEIYNDIDALDDIRELIFSAIEENPPLSVKDGKMIKSGYNAELDSLKGDLTNSTDILAEIEAREKERTDIKNLKVRYNKVFGYYIEVTNSFLDRVPDDYIRKQTLTNCERFITEELKQIEQRLLTAKDRSEQLEFELFDEIRKKTANELIRFQKTASAVALLDALCSLANVSVENNYCRPLINNDGSINIIDGRHPVVEKVIRNPFVSNDTYLNTSDNRSVIITGPNMAGKSTYMRQTALIVLMAQIGCFVPASSAQIGIVDAIFTRVGASDDLASGQSTFMVEMSEVADILKNATKKSLLILDEIGRGTSTFDGMSIAKAVLEYVNDKKKLGAKTLFATHYHELTAMEDEFDGVKNYNVAVKKRGDDITFLRRIVKGAADDSYGIEVAKLSGIPESVITRAKAILKEVENEGIVTYKTFSETDMQLPLEMQNATSVLKELQAIDVNTLTPIEAMQILFDICNKAKE